MPEYNRVVEELVVQRGEKKGPYFIGDVTSQEILDLLEVASNQVNHNRVLHTIRASYPQSSFERDSGGIGYIIHVRIRTK